MEKIFIVKGNGWSGVVRVFHDINEAREYAKEMNYNAGCEGSYERFVVIEKEVA